MLFARQLDYYSKECDLCQELFRIFLQSFGGVFRQGVYSRVVVGWVLCVGVMGDNARSQSLSRGYAATAPFTQGSRLDEQ